jgi:hypothetical protein
MNIHKLPYLWRGAGVKLAELAATYPGGHPTQDALMQQCGALNRCAKDLESALQAMVDEEREVPPLPELRKVWRGHVRFHGENIRVNVQDGEIVRDHLGADGGPLVIEYL